MVARKNTKSAVIQQYQDAIKSYQEGTQLEVDNLREAKRINYWQAERHTWYNSAYYHWLYGGKALWALKAEPCRLYGWVREETTLHQYRFYFSLFQDFVKEGTEFVKYIQDAQAGLITAEEAIKRLPSKAIDHVVEVYLVDEGKTADQMTMAELVREVKWVIQSCVMDMQEDHSEETKREAEGASNHCRTWLMNHTAEEVVWPKD